MDKVMLENWRPHLNVMQRVNVELDIARTCLREPLTCYVGRKEFYELKRDWKEFLQCVFFCICDGITRNTEFITKKQVRRRFSI